MGITSGELFKIIREELGYEPAELSKILGLSDNYFYNVEIKKINPSTSIRDKIIRMYIEDSNGDREKRIRNVKDLFLV